MNIENPLAYRFILQDDVYLLDADKQAFKKKGQPIPEAVVVNETPKPVFKYLGGHKKQYLVITHYPGIDFMETAHQAALESTLKRLGVGLDDIAIFNLATYPEAPFEQIAAFFKPEKMLVLGKPAMPPAVAAPQLNQAGQAGNIRTLFTFSFNEMMDNVEYKKAFWEAMKQF